MSIARTHVDVPASPATAPRGALMVGVIANFVLDLLAARRARRAQARIARDAEQLRNLAYSMRESAPSLADDLVAAANRAQ